MRAATLALLALVVRATPLAAQDSGTRVYLPSQVDQMPRRLSGPSLDYPAGALRSDGERVLIEAVIDTNGRVEPSSFRVVETPDSLMNASVRAIILATRYAPALVKGHPVPFLGQLWLVLRSPSAAVDATALVSAARALPATQADSALTLLGRALDTAAHASAGERMYGLLVRGVVETRMGRTESAGLDIRRGLALWRQEQAHGVELAPFLVDLADSIRLAERGARAVAAGDRLVVLGTADVAPALLSRPPVVYPPEARALGVTGTVTVEATVDATGRVTGTPTVVESPNPILNAAAVRIVQASRYRPARRGGKAVPIGIRQPVTFRP